MTGDAIPDRGPAPVDHGVLPYRIAVLCYLYDERGRVLLLHRRKSPNAGLYSPIGGKLEVTHGESPHACAAREIQEETGLRLQPDEIRLAGIVSETAYEGETHWLIFLFEVERPVDPGEIVAMEMDEGSLVWVEADAVAGIGIPTTDRTIMWPLVQHNRGGFFVVHIDCRVEPMQWTVSEGTVPEGFGGA
ncbi:MAG: NUDIX domain-containing protein [Phycisphaerales bacterium]|nr:NUDIX domain-containing protein [Phycisphaerae bacterium]NNF42885.1 NUDIX domain-containing protein [Phycisphaerales bacterium]NNM26568.1 NUDIX domain-containing protein [Phycisphaerales bacterium]